jgi:hypothetical protein
LYYAEVGSRATVNEFVWTVNAILQSDTKDILSISKAYIQNKALFYIEFSAMEAVENFNEKTGKGALSCESGTLFLPVDPSVGFTIVTLQGVYGAITCETLEAVLCEFGSVNLICKGFHCTGAMPIYNGKTYVIFGGDLVQHLPHKLTIGSCEAQVKYIGCPIDGKTKHHSYICSRATTCTNPAGHSEKNKITENALHESSGKSDYSQHESETETKDSETNTERLVDHQDADVQTESFATCDVDVQCAVSSADNSIQTMTLADFAKECRQGPRRKLIPIKKRKRACSGQTLNLSKDLKSRKLNTKGIQAYFHEQRTTVQSENSSTSGAVACIGPPSCEFSFVRDQISDSTKMTNILYMLQCLDQKCEKGTKEGVQLLKKGQG